MARSNSAVAAIAPARQPSPHPGPPRATPPRPTRPSGPVERAAPGLNVPLAVIIGTLLIVNAVGFPYYILPMAERVRSPLHPWFRPSGYVGQTAGILALVIFLFLWLYPLRKRYRWLAFTGSVGRWLDVHVTVAFALPILLAIHASWRFDGLIGLGFAAIMVVCLSGVVGKYLYARIPRSRSGIELGIEELGSKRKVLIGRIAESVGASVEEIEPLLQTDATPYEGKGILETLWQMWRDDRARARMERNLRRRWASTGMDRATLRGAMKLASREMSLTQQSRMLAATHRIFRYWHVAHRPFAITALLAVLIHVAVVVAVGMTWFW